MARFDVWLKLQRDLVDNGTVASTVVLEAPDQSRAATWPIGFRDLEESIAGMVQSLTESLPKGRHQCRLVSFDVNGVQLSMLPVVVVGASEAASEAAQGRVGQERANALFIGNAEKFIALQQQVIENASGMVAELHRVLEVKDRQLDQIIEATKTTQIELMKATGREERLAKLGMQFAPLLEVAVSFAAAYASDWFQKRPEIGKGDSDAKRPEPEGGSASPGDESAVSCAASDAPQPIEPKADGTCRTERDCVSDSGGSTAAPKYSEPKRKQSRK
jgi:uncharacterized coiled-coil protein SlyX